MKKPPLPALDVRLLSPGDSITELTSLLHAAYAPLAAAGMRFVASHQDERTTRHRIENCECWIAVLRGTGGIVGTFTVRPPQHVRGCAWYDRGGVAVCGQFAVEPTLQGRGLGRSMMRLAEDRALALGASELALDTSEHAVHLIEMYERWGFRHVGRAKWESVNYESVVLSKTLPRASVS